MKFTHTFSLPSHNSMHFNRMQVRSFFLRHFSLLFLVAVWSNNVFSVHNMHISSCRTAFFPTFSSSLSFFFSTAKPAANRNDMPLFCVCASNRQKKLSRFVLDHFQCKSSIRMAAHAFDASKTKKKSEKLQKLFHAIFLSPHSTAFAQILNTATE